MASIARALRNEMQRIARIESRQATAALRRISRVLKHTAADLKHRIVALEKDSRRLLAAGGLVPTKAGRPSQDEVESARITAGMIRRIRQRLGITQREMARLAGVSAQSVYQWERKSGRLRFRGQVKERLVALRKLGVREARQKLAELKESGGRKAKSKARARRGSSRRRAASRRGRRR